MLMRRRAMDPWTTADLHALTRLRRREGQRSRVLLWCLAWWNITLAASNVAHYVGKGGIGYGLALLVHICTSVYAVAQLWRTRRAPSTP